MSSDSTYKLLWAQEFSDLPSGHVSEEIWNHDIGDGSSVGLQGWGNNELEYYIKEAVRVDKNLVITASKVSSESGLTCFYGPAEWTSGKIHTANKVGFKFGRIDIKAKMPSGVGTWPALWMLGANLLSGTSWPQCGEIDILENTGAHPFKVQGTIHGEGYCGENGLTKIIESPTKLADQFHEYSVEWSPDAISWYFNGEQYSVINRADLESQGKHWPFSQEFYLVLNLAIGGWFAGEVEPSLTKAELIIESIRFSSVNGVGNVYLH